MVSGGESIWAAEGELADQEDCKFKGKAAEVLLCGVAAGDLVRCPLCDSPLLLTSR